MARNIDTRNYTLSCRYKPGSLGDGGSLDNGAIISQEFYRRADRDKRAAELRADARVQWVDTDEKGPTRKGGARS